MTRSSAILRAAAKTVALSKYNRQKETRRYCPSFPHLRLKYCEFVVILKMQLCNADKLKVIGHARCKEKGERVDVGCDIWRSSGKGKKIVLQVKRPGLVERGENLINDTSVVLGDSEDFIAVLAQQDDLGWLYQCLTLPSDITDTYLLEVQIMPQLNRPAEWFRAELAGPAHDSYMARNWQYWSLLSSFN